MKLIRKINFQFAVKAILWVSALVIIFHVLILSGVIPYQLVWGGRLENVEQMRRFEALSIAANLFIAATAAMKGGYLKALMPAKVETMILWGLCILFGLNTVGNLLSKTSLETILFTPITLLLAVLFLRIAVERRAGNQQAT